MTKKARKLTEMADDIEDAFLSFAYAAYAATITDAAKASFKAFVESSPCSTGISQFSSKIDSPVIQGITGRTVVCALGTTQPVLGRERVEGRNFMVKKANKMPQSPGNVVVEVKTPNLETVGRFAKNKRLKFVKFRISQRRMNHDDPYERRRGSDYSVPLFTSFGPWMRELAQMQMLLKKHSRPKLVDPRVVRLLHKVK